MHSKGKAEGIMEMKDQEAQKWIELLLPQALSKCGNMADAEDLVQETLLVAIAYQAGGRAIADMSAFLHTVLHRKFYDQLRRKYRLPTVSIAMGEDFADDEDFVQRILSAEEAERVRREVAYLADSYRTILAEHYFRGKSVKAIAEAFHLPEGTIKSRLHFGVKQLQKGFEKMETYTENSYMPQILALSNSGRFGLTGEPMSLVAGDPLAQNLLILAYEKPVGITELSKAIGVSAAYVEPVVNKLVNGELMKRMGDGKVYTDFIIYQAEDHVKYIKEQEAFAEAYAEPYCNAVKNAIGELKQTSFYDRRLERFLLIYVAEEYLYKCLEGLRAPQIFPERPNGGGWIAFGTVYPHKNYTIPADKCGKEEYGLAGLRVSGLNKYLDAENLQMLNFESSLYPFPKHSGYGFQMFQEVENNMLKLFYLIKKGIAPETVDCDPRILKGIPLLEERGFLTTKNGTPELLIPCLTHAEDAQFAAIAKKAGAAFAEQIREPLWEYVQTHKKSIPAHLKSVPDQKRTMPYEPQAMMFVFEAIKRGIHPRDLGYPCPETFVVFD